MPEKFCKYFILFLELATSGIEPKLAVHETTVLPIHFLAYHKCVFLRSKFIDFFLCGNLILFFYLDPPGPKPCQGVRIWGSKIRKDIKAR
jgi:hypothetical protein